jgi:hypothetical protein
MRTPKPVLPFFVGLLVTITFAALTLSQNAVPMLINYQGELRFPITEELVPDGVYNIVFRIYDAESGGTALWQGVHSDVNGNPVPVTDGIFNVILGSGAGNALDTLVFGKRPDVWLEITIERETLKPRQRMTSTAYSMVSENSRLLGGKEPSEYVIQAQGLRLETNDTSPNVIGGHGDNAVTVGSVGATIAGGGLAGSTNTATDDFCTIGGGEGNQAGDEAGTTTDARYATVGGGYFNTASDDYATVGGGRSNTSAGRATVSGGEYNTASGFGAAVGGGSFNTASGGLATVGGGFLNTASGSAATIGGGNANAASGEYATVCGGRDNTAEGDYSFAAGRGAKANHQGSFVLADSTDEDFGSAREDALRVRFNGGATFVVNDDYWVRFWGTGTHLIDASNGAHLTTGGVWTNGSDRDAKENFARVDSREVLAELARLPINTWNYKAEDPSVRHMGPMAQDLYAAFGLGSDDKSIGTVDADGVALAAIQGLHEIVQEKENRISTLEERNAELETRLAVLEALVQTLVKERKDGKQ